MPQNKFALVRYHLIDSLLRSRNYVKTSLIVDYCCNRTGYTVSRRTIQMDLEAMKNDDYLGYFAPIEYDTHKKAYYYSDPNYLLHPFGFSRDNIVFLQHILTDYGSFLSVEDSNYIQELVHKFEHLI